MHSRNTTAGVVIMVCLSTVAVEAAGSDPSRILVRRVETAGPSAEIARVAVAPDVYQRIVHERSVTLDAFPLPGERSVTLQLDPIEILTTATRFVAVDDSGERDVARPVFRAFRGVVTGEPGSVVNLNLFDGRIGGFVRTADGEFSIVPDSFAPGAGGLVTIRKTTSDPDAPDTPMCGGDLPAPPVPVNSSAERGQAQGAPPIDSNTVLSANVAIDATYQWYANFGNLAAAQNYILNLMAQVSTIYENEVNVVIEVPYLRIFETQSDPYTDTTSTGTLLSDLVAEWNANQTGISRTVVHLFSKRASGGAGIAYIDSLCTHTDYPGNSWDYGVSTVSALGGSWEKALVAHELGHNFSSPHTHCYSPEIDQCANQPGCYEGPVSQTTGTIMSYCSSKAPVFHPRVEDEKIRVAAEAAHPTCISTATGQTLPAAPQNVTVF